MRPLRTLLGSLTLGGCIVSADPGAAKTHDDSGRGDTGAFDSAADGTTPDTAATPTDARADTALATETCPPGEDLDGDGEAQAVGACGSDCHDGNKSVFAKQKTFFSTPYTTRAGGSSFDYDCDGVETKQYSKRYSCVPAGTGCTLDAGFEGDIVPACGAAVKMVTGCVQTGGVCAPTVYSYATVVQGCR